MESTKIIFEKMGEGVPEKKEKNTIINSEKNLLLVGGTLDELNEYIRDGYGPPEINIITLNIDPKENPDITGSIETKNIIPPKYFDIIYFSAVPTKYIDMKKAFNISYGALKDDGVLFFKGTTKLDFLYPPNKNTLLTADKTEVDIVSLLKNENFPLIKKLRFTNGSFAQSEVMAAKSSSFDLVETSRKFPVIDKILIDCTGRKYDDLAYALQSKEEELIDKLNIHLNTKENTNTLEEDHKVKVLKAAITVLQGHMDMDDFNIVLLDNPKYKEGFFSQTEALIQEFIDFKNPKTSPDENKSSSCSIQ